MVKPATFVFPMGGLVPLLAIAVSLLILAGATRSSCSAVHRLLAGAALFVANDRLRQRAGR